MTRLALALAAALGLTACDSLLGLHDITPDGEPVALSIIDKRSGVVAQPLGSIRVQAIDVLGKPVVKFAGEVRIALGANPGGGALIGGLTATAKDGTATFDLLGITAPGSGYTLTFSADDLPTATSEPFDVLPPRFTPVPTGAAGGQVWSVAVARMAGASVVFAGASDGVYKSVDNAATWTPSSFGGFPQGIVIADPQHPGTLYLRIQYGSYVKKSTDGGATWRTLDGTDYVYAFAIDPRDSSNLYEIAGNLTFRRSADGGATWTAGGRVACRNLVVDVTVADTFYCARYDESTGQNSGLAKSSNGGATWTAANTGIPTPSNASLIGATPSGVFASSDSGTYRSTDHGESWNLVTTYGYAVAAAPSNPDRVYLSTGGVAVSTNGGQSFGTPVNIGDFVQFLAVDPTNPNLVYAAGSNGVYVSSTGGATWTPASKGIDAHNFSSVQLAPGAPNIVLTSYNALALRSTNGGKTWATTPEPSAVNFFIDPDVRTRIWMCGYGVLARSEDSGASFAAITTTGLETSCNRLLFGGTSMYAMGGNGLFVSVNRGATWTRITAPAGAYVYDAAVTDPTGTSLVIATSTGMYRSTNSGGSFSLLSSNYSNRVAADPKVPTRVISGECPGFRVSTDLGATFGATITGPCVQQLTATGGALWATGTGNLPSGDQQLQLLRSLDGGASWSTVELTGLPFQIYTSGVAASEDGSTVFIATGAGLYKGSFD
jgi:photosystem II stability/assembly factor-like uncharacterized protein